MFNDWMKAVRGAVVFAGCAVVALAAAGLSGCGGDDSKGKAGPAAQAAPAPEVVVARIERTDIPLNLEYMGQTAGSREVEVRARVGGILLRRTYEEGQRVRQGELMFEIDPAPFDAALDQAKGQLGQAEARLNRARRDMERMRKLHEGNVVSQKDRDDAESEFDAASAEVASAQAKVKEARINLGYTRVEAPISGMTSKETRSEGSLLTTTADGSLLTTISKVDPIYVNFSMPGQEVLRLRKLREDGKLSFNGHGDYVARIVLSDGSTYAHEGRINFTDTQVDPQTGVVRIRAEFPNPDGLVLPGQFARIKLLGATFRQALAVPQGAVLRTQQANLVWVVDDAGVVRPQPVVMGEAVGNDYLIEQGLSGGERIIVEGVIKVRPGLTVRTRENAPAGQPVAQPAAPSQDAPKTDKAQ